MAGAVFSLLALTATVLVAAGVLLAPYLIDLLTPGFAGDKRVLTVQASCRRCSPGWGCS